MTPYTASRVTNNNANSIQTISIENEHLNKSKSSHSGKSKKRKHQTATATVTEPSSSHVNDNPNELDNLVMSSNFTNTKLTKCMANLKFHTERIKYWENQVSELISETQNNLKQFQSRENTLRRQIMIEFEKREEDMKAKFEHEKRLAIQAAKEEANEQSNILQCNICLTKNKDSVLIPCRHTYCEDCADHMINDDKCAYCRSFVIERVKIYLEN
jgi:hypothetical protein